MSGAEKYLGIWWRTWCGPPEIHGVIRDPFAVTTAVYWAGGFDTMFRGPFATAALKAEAQRKTRNERI